MEKANDTQIGGEHYRKSDYQVWDFITDVKMPYLLGCVVKYVMRYEDKNGIEDLNKARHYLAKAKERKLGHWRNETGVSQGKYKMLVDKLMTGYEINCEIKHGILYAIGDGFFNFASSHIQTLIEREIKWTN